MIGHSQGAFLVRFLLRKRFDNNPFLRFKLVVAISGGEVNYYETDSGTGGSLQNIKTFPAVDSSLEFGCLITWRTWEMGAAVEPLEGKSFLFNKYFVDLGLIYQTYDSKCHQESNYNFGYLRSNPPKKLTRYITLGADKVNYIGFNDMFSAQETSAANVPGSRYIMIENNNIPNDQRAIPAFPQIPPLLQSIIPKDTYHYHIWDMQFVQGDLLQLLPILIAKCR